MAAYYTILPDQFIIRDYFVNGKLIYDTDEGPVENLVTNGMPQGSVLLLLWNVMYEALKHRDKLPVLVMLTISQLK